MDIDPKAKERNGKWQHLVQYCLDLYEEFKGSEYRKKTIETIKKSKEAYNQDQKHTSDPWEGSSNLILPFTTISCDNLAPRLAAGLIGKRPYVRFELENDQKPDEQTEIVETFFDQELEDVVGIEQVAIDEVEKLLQEGTVYTLPKYEVEEITRKDFAYTEDGKIANEVDPETGEPTGLPQIVDITDTVHEGAAIEFVPFEYVFTADNVDDEDWDKEPIFRYIFPSYGDLQREKDYKGYIKDNIGPWLLKDETQKKLETQTTEQERDDVKQTSKEVIKCLECSVSYVYQKEDEDKEDIKNWEEERLLATIAVDSRTILRIRPLRDVYWKNRHLLRRHTMFRKRGESYGLPLFAKIKAIQEGANKTFNTAINIAEVVLIPWFLYTDKLGLPDREKKLKPGEGVKVDDISQIFFPTFPIRPDQMFNYLEIWVSFWERLVSIGDLQIGRTDQSKETATEVLAVIQEGNIKHNYQSRPLRKNFVEMIRTIYDLYYQYMPLNKTFLWNGQQVPIPRAAMKRQVKFRLTGSTEMSNKLIERRENEDFFQLVMADPKGVFNPVTAAKDLVKSYNKTNVEEYVNPTIAQIVQVIQQIPQAVPLFQQAMQEAMAMAQEIEQGGNEAIQ